MSVKKVLINAFAARRGGGVTYVQHFLHYLPIRDDLSFTLLCGDYNINLFREYMKGKKLNVMVVKHMKNPFIRTFYEMFILPLVLWKWHYRILYAPSGIMTMFLPVPGLSKFTALRNILPLDEEQRRKIPFFSWIRWKLLILRYMHLESYKLYDGVVFISSYSRDCVAKLQPEILKKTQLFIKN